MDYKKSTYKKKTAAPKVQYKPKRGKLAPVMSEDEKASAGIHELSYDFGCRIIRLFQYLTEDSDYKEFVISKQIYRSGTSIGANVRESKHAQSDADFLSKASIALKEARESENWLSLLRDNGYLSANQAESILSDCSRINKILITITSKVKKRINGPKE